MKTGVNYLAFCLAVAVASTMLLEEAVLTHAVTCNPSALSPCAAALLPAVPPSTTCCVRLREQTPCLCGYYRSPSLQPYLGGNGPRKICWESLSSVQHAVSAGSARRPAGASAVCELVEQAGGVEDGAVGDTCHAMLESPCLYIYGGAA
ncbi:hypothetical protein Nepgr_029049 [Nepenthes gracilis]|uniref:Bifunctional inhibitor/plant lipid transfer protein/seed storage helical domain-containing protein n=1 Tax=Nepenthes gracilis TaxID=150966 RepID=A0AAD3TDH0_NEPGR|nr:hypothetical protein Nepgr_029049 [Nepenthes gracilis]